MFKKSLSLVLLATLFLFWNESASARILDFKPITDPEKPWTITFNDDVSKQADLNSIRITSNDKVNHAISITISADLKKVIVKPLNPYHFGTDYTLIIPKGFESAKGEKLKADVTLPFKLQGIHIQTIDANWNALATNVIVQGSTNVAKVTASLNGTPEKTLNRLGTEFSRGIQGLLPGDPLTIRVYDEKDILLETQTYTVK